MRTTFYLLLFFVLALAIHTAFGPRSTFQELEASAVALHQAQSIGDTLLYAPTFDSLVREKALKEALYNLSLSDSISLIVNLRDSTVRLSIKGVNIHTSKVEIVKTDPLLTRLSTQGYAGLFSGPLKVQEERATIVKEPVVVVEAPKDTIEATQNAYKPDTLIQNPAYVKWTLDHGITIRLDQGKSFTWSDRWTDFTFSAADWSERMALRLGRFLTLQKPLYEPEICLEIPANDLRSIYRALPVRASVVVGY